VIGLVGTLSDALLFFLPGFVALKLFYTFGLKSTRTDFEWTVWSVLASLVLFAATEPLRRWLALDPNDVPNHLLLMGVGVVSGLSAAWCWNLRAIRIWRLQFIAEPWDLLWATARQFELQAVVELDDGREVQGDIEWMGLSGEGSSRSITFVNAQITNDSDWLKLPSGDRFHIPESSVHILRLVPYEPLGEASPP
jgi:hypothetical protein